MPIATAPADTRGPSIARSARGRVGPIAIVDIGSNSVRLVIYESFSRIPAVVHNEKAICAIGRSMVTTGKLNDDGIVLALEALGRFRMIADAHHVDLREAVATAAARDASKPSGAGRSGFCPARKKRGWPPKGCWPAFRTPTDSWPIWVAAASTW